MKTARSALIGLLLVTSLAACSSAAAPSASPAPATPAVTDPPPTQVPGGNPSEAPDGSNVGGGGGANPAPGEGPQFVVPKPGTKDPHPVSVETLEARVEGTKVTIVAGWWSGVEPCYQLDTVNVKRDGNGFTIALMEGNGDPDTMCIELAVQKATAIDLGDLEPGEYTVRAQDGTAEPIAFTVG